MKQLLLVLILFSGFFGYSQVPNSWTKRSDFGGLKRERAVAFSANGYGFVGTGIDTAENVLRDFWRYDALTDSWTQVADLPGTVRRDAVAFALNDFGYVTTGLNADESNEVGAMKLSDMWKYDPTANSWSVVASYPGNSGQGVYFAAAFVVEGYAYVVGGKWGPNSYSNELFRYDPVLDQWTALAAFPGGVRYQLSAFGIGDKGYVGLGTDQDLYRNDWWEYKPSTNTWAPRADLPASERANAATFTIDDRGFVCTGSNGGVLGDLWEYNPYSNTWISRAPYGGSARKSATAFVLDNRAYLGTGKGASGKKQSFYEYNPMWTLGTNEIAAEVRVYPNPASEVVNVQSNFPIDALRLMNLQGKVVKEVSQNESIAVHDLPSGVYILSAIQEDQIVSSQKIIIQ